MNRPVNLTPSSTFVDVGAIFGIPIGSALMVELIVPPLHSFILEWLVWAGLACVGWLLYGIGSRLLEASAARSEDPVA